MVIATEEIKRDYIGHYSINIDPNDILIALPKDSYSTGCSKILILKYNDSVTVTEKKALATLVYYRPETGKFYTDADFNNLLVPSAGKYYVDGNFKSKNEYYIYDA